MSYRGGGFAIVLRRSFSIKKNNSIGKSQSFEYIDLTLKFTTKSARIIVVYRPLLSKENILNEATFFNEFSSLLETLVPSCGSEDVLIVGDFNFHINDVNNESARRFSDLITSFDYESHVFATHKRGHTLDLILTISDDKFVSGVNVIDPAISEHFAVNCKLLFAKPTSERKCISFRNTKSINFDLFRADRRKFALVQKSNTVIDTFAYVDPYEKNIIRATGYACTY